MPEKVGQSSHTKLMSLCLDKTMTRLPDNVIGQIKSIHMKLRLTPNLPLFLDA